MGFSEDYEKTKTLPFSKLEVINGILKVIKNAGVAMSIFTFITIVFSVVLPALGSVFGMGATLLAFKLGLRWVGSNWNYLTEDEKDAILSAVRFFAKLGHPLIEQQDVIERGVEVSEEV